MAEQVQSQAPAQQPSAKGQVLNDRTYQEVEYLKKNLGPILVAALAEICIRRPADPIEYLGHWLLRWRYNEELKRRDVQNALEVVRQKAYKKDDENQAPPPGQGFTPASPFPAPGYGGPIEAGAAEAGARKSGVDPTAAGAEDLGERRASAEHPASETRPSGDVNRASVPHVEGEHSAEAGEELGARASEGAEGHGEAHHEIEDRRASAMSKKSHDLGREHSGTHVEDSPAAEEPPAPEEHEAPEPPAPEEGTAE